MTKAKPGEEASSPLPHEAATTADSRCDKHQAGASSGVSGHHRRTSGPLPRKVVGVHDPPARLPSEAAGETGPAMRHRSKPAEASNPLPFLGSGHKKAGFAMRRAPDHKDVQPPTTLAATASALDSRRGAPHQPRPISSPLPSWQPAERTRDKASQSQCHHAGIPILVCPTEGVKLSSEGYISSSS